MVKASKAGKYLLMFCWREREEICSSHSSRHDIVIVCLYHHNMIVKKKNINSIDRLEERDWRRKILTPIQSLFCSIPFFFICAKEREKYLFYVLRLIKFTLSSCFCSFLKKRFFLLHT